MSIVKATYKGDYVYATEGEKLRGKVVQCVYCGCDMYIHRFPGRRDYYFACVQGKTHTGETCKKYENKRNIPQLPKATEDFFAYILRPDRDKTGGDTIVTPRSPRGSRTMDPEEDGPVTISRMRTLTQLMKAGIFEEKAEERVYFDADYRYIDLIILRPWARLIWKNVNLEAINERVINAVWVGSLDVGKNKGRDEYDNLKGVGAWENRMARFFATKKELWLTLTGQAKGKTTFIRFCLDCVSCFSAIKERLFISGVTANGAYSTYIPRKSKLEVFAAGSWATMVREDCYEKCPLHMCNGCIGAYWAKCNSIKQVVLVDDKYKEQKKK